MVDVILERLKALHPKSIDLSLERIDRLLGDLERPQDALPPVVHVAGTNGKGSTIAYLRAFFEAAGFRVHVYTSPHLVRFAERIRVAGEIIDNDALAGLLEECERVNAGRPITFFEITTAAAFLAFARNPADITLLETGLGGRLDATNVVERPALTALTPISLDHQQYLGDHIEAIAAEKAAIMKRAVPCVVADQERRVNRVLEARSLEYGVPLYKEGADWFVRSHPAGLAYRGRSTEWVLPAPALAGQHQMRNAGLALACAERLGERFALPEGALALGLRTVEWPARLQHLGRGPLVEMLPEGWELWLDGGHNPAAGKALSQSWRAWRDKPLDVVFGMLGTKDAAAFLKPLAPRIRRIRTVAVPGEPASQSPEQAAAAAAAAGIQNARPFPGVAAAVADLVAGGGPPARILVCGSLYLAGNVLAENG